MPPQDAPRPEDPKSALIARINDLSQLARTAWFSLLGYLVFVGITLLGVKDADFFVATRQTDLPLVGVEIPTASFFWTAPVLGAALYTYLHLFLIKLWDAHAEARTIDADATHHWLVGDFVLLRQRDETTLSRPLAWLVIPITLLLVWAAGPIVLAYAWWRSMPAHNEWLTLIIAACLWLTLVVGVASWRRTDFLFGPHPLRWTTGAAVPLAGLAASALVAITWLRTEGGLDRYVAWGWTLDDVSFTIAADTPVVRWFTGHDLRLPLARTDLAGEDLVALPDSWRSPKAARSTFRKTWCEREGLKMEVCGQLAAPGVEESAPLVAERIDWCAQHGLRSDACGIYFVNLDSRFVEEWREERASALSNLKRLDLNRKDLRQAEANGISLVGAILAQAKLAGADLREARLAEARLDGAQLQETTLWAAQMERVSLTFAHMAGAKLSGAPMHEADFSVAKMYRTNLTNAHLEGAIFIAARMEHADLGGAWMMGADLCGAQMQNANLGRAQMDSAVFTRAQMKGAYLNGAMKGADFSGAKMEGVYLVGAEMEGVILRSVDLREAQWASASTGASPAHFADLRGAQDLTQAQLEGWIGNSDTLLPEGNAPDTDQPFHVWSCWDMPPPGFDRVLAAAAGRSADDADRRALRDEFLCGREPPHKTGTLWPLDKPRPPSHPLDKPRPPGHPLGD